MCYKAFGKYKNAIAIPLIMFGGLELTNEQLYKILRFPSRDIEDEQARDLAKGFDFIKSNCSKKHIRRIEDVIFREGTWPLVFHYIKKMT